MPDSANSAQIAVVAEQVVAAAITKLRIENPELLAPTSPQEAPIHPLVKWLVGAIAGLGSAALIGLGFWLVTSVSQMRETLARLDERMITGSIKDGRYDELERRVSKNEAAIAEMTK